MVRPAARDGAARGQYRHRPNVGKYLLPGRIARADVADFMLPRFTDDPYLKNAPGVCYYTVSH